VNECDINKCIIPLQLGERQKCFKELWYESSLFLCEQMPWQRKNKEIGQKKPSLKKIEQGKRTVQNRQRKSNETLKERCRKCEVM
jgi:hypothetical protein